MEEFPYGTIVRSRETGKLGVITSDPYGVCGSTQVPVHWGDGVYVGTYLNKLERYTPQEADLLTEEHVHQVCQPGSENTCSFLIVSAEGLECAKRLPETRFFRDIDDRRNKGEMKAKGDNCEGKFAPHQLVALA